ncbi:MAG: choice-of-anchor V domain-containing protein [Bacteroidia bacterium]
MKKIITFIFLLSLMSVSYLAFNNAAGPPSSQTGAPGETNCTSCHSGTAITSGTNWGNISFSSNIPSGGYTPGSTYSLTLSLTQSGITRYGFEITALTSSTNTAAGTLTAGSGQGSTTSGGRYYVYHSSSSNYFSSGTASWTFSWTAPTPGVSGVAFYAAINASNNDGTSSGDQIYTKSFSVGQFGVGPPTAVITADKTTICTGDTVHFHGSGNNNPTGWSWTFGAGASPASSSVQNPVVIYNSAGTRNATLMTTNAYGTSGITLQPITVNAKPSAVVTPSGTLALCGTNDSIVLSATSQTGVTYLWFPTNDTSQSIIVKSAGTYRVTFTNSNNCVATSSTIVVQQKTIPTVTLTSADSACSGDTVLFSGSGNFITYKFLMDTQTVQNSSVNIFKTASLNSSNVFSLYAVDSFGCKTPASNFKSVLVRTPVSAPVTTCGTQTSGSVQFIWSAVNGAIGYEISNDTGKTWQSPSSGATGLSHTISGLTGGNLVNLRVRANTQGACAHGLVASKTCQTLGCPYVSFNYSGPKFSCLANDTSSRLENISIANVNAINYSVNINNNGFSSSLSKQVSLIKGTNNIHIKIFDSLNAGCPQTDSVIVVTGVNSPITKAVLSFSSTGIDTTKQFCLNSTQSIFSSKPTGANRYYFLRNSVDTFQLGNSNSFVSSIKSFLNNDMATVIAMDTNYGCSKISDGLKVVVNQNPKAGFKYWGTNSYPVPFTDTSCCQIKNWNWWFGDSAFAPNTSTSQNPSHPYTQYLNKVYNVTLVVLDSNGCRDSINRQINVQFEGVNEVSFINNLQVFPNPAKGLINLSFNLKERSDVQIQIFDLYGKEVFQYSEMNEGAGQKEFPISLEEKKPSGIYLLMIRSGDQKQVVKFVKE